MKDSGYTDPTVKLLTLGETDYRAGWTDYGLLGITWEHVHELIRMLADESLHMAKSDRPEVWAPVHAWRALAQLRAPEAIEPLLQQLFRIDVQNDDFVAEEFPEVFAMIGVPAIPALANYLADPKHGLYARVCAVHALAKIGQETPDVREQCVALLTRQLKGFGVNDEALNGFIICYLVKLKAVESIGTIQEAYRQDCVALDVVGDFEDVEMDLGIRERRSTPHPRFQWVPEAQKPRSSGNDSPPASRKVGRNEPCPCGSGKKHKKCCLNKG